MRHLRTPLAVRFERFVLRTEDPNACWLWTGNKGSTGYGQIRSGGKPGVPLSAHCVAFEITFGPIPPGLWVLHKCDNRPRVNPAHLFLGTNAENVADMCSKGRQSMGETVPAAKLTDSQVLEVRRRYAAGGVFQRVLAGEFGVDRGTISKAIRRETWSHI